MDSDDTRRARPEGDASEERPDRYPTGEETPAQVAGTAARGLVGALAGRFFLLNALVWMFVGGGLLTGAWVLVGDELERRERVATFEGRADGVIESPADLHDPGRRRDR
jgi:hypothetical protein